MAEPNSTALAGAKIGAGTALPFAFFVPQIDALVLGMIAAFLASIMLKKIDDRPKAVAAVLLSSLLAAYCSPVAAQWVASAISGISITEELRLTLALLIGAVTPSIVPIAIAAIGKKVKGA
jgi:hypothetical protein